MRDEGLGRWHDKIRDELIPEIHKIIIGQDEAIEHCVLCLLSGSSELKAHMLLEGVPGVAKTRLAKTFATVIGGKFGRIQGTPDLLPTDITGLQIWNQKTQGFEPRPGPIFASIVLLDEINRMPPKTQSALLEAMQEGGVTIGERTFNIPDPFLVIATQNPIEQMGTFGLSEAQADRFLMKIKIGYPLETEEVSVALQINNGVGAAAKQIFGLQDVLALRDLIRTSIHIEKRVADFIVSIVRATRPDSSSVESVKENVWIGSSPRASIALVAAAKVKAFIAGSDFVRPDDVEHIAPAILRHRIILSSTEGDLSPSDYIEKLLAKIIERVRKEKYGAK